MPTTGGYNIYEQKIIFMLQKCDHCLNKSCFPSTSLETNSGSDYSNKKKCGDKGTIGKPCSKNK